MNARVTTSTVGDEERCCPLCLQELAGDGRSYGCPGCGARFEHTPLGQWDFRIRPGMTVAYRDAYAPPAGGGAMPPARLEAPCPTPRNRFEGPVPWHLTRDQITYIPAARPGAIALDLGCGSGPHRPLLEALGYRYHGVDLEGADADDLVDAHALPYRDAAFDLVLSIGVLGQLEQPALAMGEMHRVLKPGGFAIGTVPSQEPFNGHGCFNFTHVGLATLLVRAGLRVDAILCIRCWHAMRAQLHMGFDWRLPERAADWMSRPFLWTLEAYGAIGRRWARNRGVYDRHYLHARHAAAFFFAAERCPAAVPGAVAGARLVAPPV